MSSHSPHPRMGTEAIVYDDCERCEQHANAHGITLDRDNLIRMWSRMLDVEVHGSSEYLTENERKLGYSLDRTRVLLEKYASQMGYRRWSRATQLSEGIDSFGIT